MTKCIFCGEEITPEEAMIDSKTRRVPGYTFQCENLGCGAIYDSVGPKIPDIRVRYKPIIHQELDFSQ